jgi:hypothetical protein
VDYRLETVETPCQAAFYKTISIGDTNLGPAFDGGNQLQIAFQAGNSRDSK